jgi:hypothetical protein
METLFGKDKKHIGKESRNAEQKLIRTYAEKPFKQKNNRKLFKLYLRRKIKTDGINLRKEIKSRRWQEQLDFGGYASIKALQNGRDSLL